jgi:Right handed beta helix region
VDMNGVSNVTFENSDIGPCGGRGVYINGGSGNSVYDSYIHVETTAGGCCDGYDGVFVNGSNSDTIQGNVVAYGETNIQTFNANNTVITGNFLLNPQGPFPRGEQIQTGVGTTVTITNNLLVSTPDSNLGPAIGTSSSAPILYGQDNTSNRPSDNLSIYVTQNADVENNYITGGLDAKTPYSGGAQDAAGCGLIADGSSSLAPNNARFINNILVNTGECAIGIATGTNQTVTGNKSISLNPNTGGNTADYVWNQYSPACGPVLLKGNIGTLIRSNGYASGYWNGGGCAAVTCDGTNPNIDSCNTFDYGSGRTAYNALIADPAITTPPLIPPMPKNCVATSPYSTQTSLPPC